jgi:DNA-directed RNA polymerase subunit omega
MARVTVEDCIERIPNRFALVVATAQRTKQLMRGARFLGDDPAKNKHVVNALREIADAKVNLKHQLGEVTQIAREL